MAIWRLWIVEWLLAIWLYLIAEHMLAILATFYCLNRNNRVSSFYKTRGSKLWFLICFSYFSSYFHILVFLQNCYLLISSPFFWLHGNPISRPVSRTIGTPSYYVVHAPPYISSTERVGFSKQDTHGNLVVASLPVIFPLSPFLPKVSGANVCWTERESYLFYSLKSSNWHFLA